jgi:hypothetical protein
MKNKISKIALSAALILIVFSGAVTRLEAGDKRSVTQELTMKNFENSLEYHECPGIVESTVCNIVVYKSINPDLNYSNLNSELKRIAEDNKDAAIRYKAQLASLYLDYSSIIELSLEPSSWNHEYVFKQISEQLDKKFLVSQTTE